MELTLNIKNKEVYDALTSFLKAVHIKIASSHNNDLTDENKALYNLSATHLSRAYSADEPEYNIGMVKEPNAKYEKG